MPHLHFTFPEHVKKNLESSIPLRERSRFVSQATEQALQMRRLKEALLSKRHVGTYPDLDADSFVRRLRKKGRKIGAVS